MGDGVRRQSARLTAGLRAFSLLSTVTKRHAAMEKCPEAYLWDPPNVTGVVAVTSDRRQSYQSSGAPGARQPHPRRHVRLLMALGVDVAEGR